MARLTFPDEGSRLVYRSAGITLASAAGRTALVYSDESATTLADIQSVEGESLTSLTVDSYSRLPMFLGPDNADVVYVKVENGPASPVYARSDDRIDALETNSLTFESADTRYPKIGEPQKTLQLIDEIRRGKGGRIGTGGKGVIAFRFDHQLDPFRATVWPLMLARAIPGSMGIVTRSVGNLNAGYEPTATTWTDIKAMVDRGLELWAHSATHSDPEVFGTTLYEEIVGCKAEIESHGFRVMGWQQPGGPSTYGTHGNAIPFLTPTDMDNEAGRLIRNTYGLYETYLTGTSRRTIPTDGCLGYDHVTIDTLTYPQIKSVIDHAIVHSIGTELMLHSTTVGKPASITVADLTAVFDYVVQKRNEGKLEILTASGLAFADPGVSRRLDLVPQGDFEDVSTAVKGYNWFENSAGSWTIQTDGGHTGNNYLRVTSTGTRSYAAAATTPLGINGHAFMLDAWVRSTDPAGATAIVRVRDSTNNFIVLDKHDIVLTQSTSWTRIRVPFVIPMNCDIIVCEFGRFLGGSVDWDDCHAYAV